MPDSPCVFADIINVNLPLHPEVTTRQSMIYVTLNNISLPNMALPFVKPKVL